MLGGGGVRKNDKYGTIWCILSVPKCVIINLKMNNCKDNKSTTTKIICHICMPPTLEKLKGYIALGVSFHPSISPSVRPLVRASVQNLLRYSFEIQVIDTYFLVWIISLCGVMPLLKGYNDILYSRYLKNYISYELQTWSGNRG